MTAHHVPHSCPGCGLCVCGCDTCTLRVAGGCVCDDCPCDGDHAGHDCAAPEVAADGTLTPGRHTVPLVDDAGTVCGEATVDVAADGHVAVVDTVLTGIPEEMRRALSGLYSIDGVEPRP